jgi:hypothetical protein
MAGEFITSLYSVLPLLETYKPFELKMYAHFQLCI